MKMGNGVDENKDMGFLIISEGGDGLGLALRLQEEGHKVSMSIKDPIAEQRGEGLIEKNATPEFKPVLLADCTGSGALLDSYRANDGDIFGGSGIADKLESDRKYASEVFKKARIKEPFSKGFTDWESAFEFIQNWDEDSKLVFKPEGKYSGVVPSYVPHDNEELMEMLEHYKGIIGNEPEFTLQEFVEGVCISSEVWCSKGKLLRPTNHTLERKQLMNDDLGPSGGCTGNVVWACLEEDCSLCANLVKLKDFLEENQWTGPIDINTVVSKEGEIYALEFTPRLGYDSFPTLLLGLFEGNFGSFVYDSTKGSTSPMPLRSDYASGIRVSTAPWPSEDFHAKSGIPLRGLRGSDFDRFYPYEVSLQNGKQVTSGGYGIIGVCVGYGDTIEASFDEAYKLAYKLRIPEKQMRTDLDKIFEKEVRQIERSLEIINA